MLHNRWVCAARIPSPSDIFKTEHENQQAPKTVGESIQPEKQNMLIGMAGPERVEES